VLVGAGPPARAEETEERPPGWIGIVFQPRDPGALVKLVLPDMPAEAGGVKTGDLLLRADGTELAGLDIPGVRDAISGSPGTTLTLAVRRGKTELDLQVERIDRPDDETVRALRDEAELLAMPPDRRANKRLARLPEGHGVDEVGGIWTTYAEERGAKAIREPVVMGVLGKLQKLGGDVALAFALEQVLPVADPDLSDEPRYQRRIADFLLAQEPPQAEQARARASAGLELAPAEHREHPWLQRALGEAALRAQDMPTALAASGAALETWPAPTLVWLGSDGAELRSRVTDGHSRLARSRAEVLAAAGDTGGARTVLVNRLAYRHDEGTAEDLVALGVTPPPAPRPAFHLTAEPFPEFSLPRLIGEGEISLTDLRGQPVLLALWASWCGPCKAELAHLAGVYPDLQAQGVEVLAVNVMEDREAGRAHAEAAGWTFPVLRDRNKTLTRALGLQSIPRSYVLDGEGRVARMAQGYSKAAAREQEELLAALAAGGSASPNLLSIEVGDGHLELAAFHALPQASLLATIPGEDDRLLVGTSTGSLMPLTAAGPVHEAERRSPYRPKEIHALPGGTWAAVSKKHVALLAEGEDPVSLTYAPRVAASAVVGDLLVVAPGGKKALVALDAGGAVQWTAGEEAVTWDLAPGDHGGAPAAVRVRPDGIELLSPAGATLAAFSSPVGARRVAPLPGGLLVGSPLEAAATGDLDGDGTAETTVLLNTRQVLGLSARGALLFRLQLPTAGDIACADLDGDGRDELWIASPAAGVAVLRYRPPSAPSRAVPIP